MQSKFQIRPSTIALVAGAVVLIVIAVVYLTSTAGNLPAFFPGHQAHSAHKHLKHGVACLGLAVLALVVAWFTTAPKTEGGSEG